MKAKLLYWYPDLMNLYGDNGNVRALKRHLEDQGFEMEVDCKSVGDEVRLADYLLIYMGSGTERNQKVALEDMRRFREEMKRLMEQGKVFFFTGNSFELLGRSITAGDGTVYRGLELATFETVEHSDKRYTQDMVCACDVYAKPAVGFVNKCSEVTGVERALFQVQMGVGNNEQDDGEGYLYKNVFGTHLTGPVLVKNPAFMDELVALLCAQSGIQYHKVDYPLEESAYEVTVTELLDRMEDSKSE